MYDVVDPSNSIVWARKLAECACPWRRVTVDPGGGVEDALLPECEACDVEIVILEGLVGVTAG